MAEHHHHHHHYYDDAGRTNGRPSPNPHRLYRGRNRVLGGVCAGLSAYFGWPRCFVRIGAIALLVMFPPAAIFGYLLAWWLIPARPEMPLYKSQEDERFWRNVSTRPKVTMSELRHKFRGLEGRLAEMERVVTSDEYRLKRAFRDLEEGA